MATKKKQVKKAAKTEVPKPEGSKESAKMEKVRKEKLGYAEKFKDELLKKYGTNFIKAVVIFGSLVRGGFTEKSDIDLLVVIDDVVARLSDEQKDKFDDSIQEMGKKISEDISVQPSWTLSEFWDMARIGHPLLYTIVRDGWALYDTGFFIPVRKLLELGKIPATLEAVERFMENAPPKIRRVETAKLYMIAEDLYNSMLNCSQAVLMYLGENPTTPKQTVEAVKEYLVNAKLLENEYYDSFSGIVDFRKKVEHKEIKDISGQDLDEWIDKTKRYVERMEQLLSRLQDRKKANMVEKNYEVLIKATVAALKRMDKLPPDPKDLPKAIKEDLIDKGYIDPYYSDIFKRVVTMRKLLDDDKAKGIPQREIEMMREYVRRFVRDVEPILENKGKPVPRVRARRGKK